MYSGYTMKLPITAIILTFNEELNLGNCLKSLAGWVSEIIVVDSFSTDGTEKIAKEYGAKFVQHKFANQAEQFNWALDNIPIENEWILRLDADEWLTSELKEEITGKLPIANSEVSGFMMKRRVYFMGRWIKHGGYYPIWFLRLWRNGKGRSEAKEMDEHIILTEGKADRLKNDFADDNRNGLTNWIAKHNGYASREARDFVSGLYASGDKKVFYYHLPPFLRAFLYFSYRYFIRLGFLDGAPGLMFHFLQGFWYRFLIDAKIYEMKREKISIRR